MPSEKKRVIWSAPTKACQWRSASSRRNEPWRTSCSRSASPLSKARSATRRRASTSIASWSTSSATRSTLSPRPASEPIRARAASSIRASRSARSRAITSVSWRIVARDKTVAVGVQVALANADQLRLEAGLVHQPLDVREDLGPVLRLIRHPVDDDEQWETALADPLEHRPRYAIRVARRRGHENCQVRGLDEPVGEKPVGVLD